MAEKKAGAPKYACLTVDAERQGDDAYQRRRRASMVLGPTPITWFAMPDVTVKPAPQDELALHLHCNLNDATTAEEIERFRGQFRSFRIGAQDWRNSNPGVLQALGIRNDASYPYKDFPGSGGHLESANGVRLWVNSFYLDGNEAYIIERCKLMEAWPVVIVGGHDYDERIVEKLELAARLLGEQKRELVTVSALPDMTG